MLMNSIQWDVLKLFADKSCQALSDRIDFNVESGEGFQEKIKKFHFNGYAVVVNTTGSVEGRILIHHYTETALAIANKIMDKENEGESSAVEMNDRASNALAEFSLELIEDAVVNLSKKDLKVKISPAYFIKDTQNIDQLLEGVNSIITMPMKIENVGKFYINYLLNDKI